jgi:hypothetical protein
MSAFPLDQQARFAAAIQALNGWTTTADEQNIQVDNITATFLSEPDADGNRTVICPVVFERDAETGRYGFRTL